MEGHDERPESTEDCFVSGEDAVVHYFPIRHHSPACALALLRAFEQLRPKQVLIEAPIDFQQFVGLLTDPETRPPIAIVSLPDAKAAAGERHTASYPFCSHSPELVAMIWARQNDSEIGFIDLPSRHPAMNRRRAAEDDGPVPLISDWRLDHNSYVKELCVRRGVPDALALWDALFESQAGSEDWKKFFDGVALYCRHTREATTQAEMESDGTLAREAHMAAYLLRARIKGMDPIAVVTGGFHTPALADAPLTASTEAAAVKFDGEAYPIRYSFRQLDRFSGYGAGLPHPAFYDRFWHARREGLPNTEFVARELSAFAALLRSTKPNLALPTPSLSAAMLAAGRLAQLRGLPAPGRCELIDAVRSTGVKEAMEAGRSPLMDAVNEFLTGETIGDLPPGAPQPPVVAEVRRQARALGFRIDDAAPRTRELDVLRKPRHAEASRFLFALDLIGIEFAKRVAGPDPITGWRGEALFESWSYGWSPYVESRLITRAADGQTVEALCLAELERRHMALEAEGRARSAGASAEIMVAAARTGMEEAVVRAANWCSDAIAEDSEATSLIRALALTAGLARPGPGAPKLSAALAPMRARAFDRLIMLFPDLAGTSEEGLPQLVSALRELGALAMEEDESIDKEKLFPALSRALASSLPPILDGALAAFAGLIGAMSSERVAEHVAAMLAGTFVDEGASAAVLTGCLTVSPKLVVHSEPLLFAVDAFLERVEQEPFLASLPQLRLAFGELSPTEIDRVAGWAAKRNGLSIETLLDGRVSADEVFENEKASLQLEAIWREEGLGSWLGGTS